LLGSNCCVRWIYWSIYIRTISWWYRWGM